MVGRGWADPDRVAIYGGSYGGYAALVGATFTPDAFTCAVDPNLWRRSLGMLIDGLRAEPGKASELPHPPLDEQEVEEAMTCWRP